MNTEVLEIEKEEDIIYEILRHEPLVFKSSMPAGQFHRFVLRHEDLKIERDRFGNITIHPPMTFDSGYVEGLAFTKLGVWALKNKNAGKVFSPSTSFQMPDGSTYKADGAWINNEKINKLTEAERKSIASIVPDFVMEVCSETDRIAKLKKKMPEGWMANGVRLAWLIDPLKERVFIYREGQEVEELAGFGRTLSGENVLVSFEFDLMEIKPG